MSWVVWQSASKIKVVYLHLFPLLISVPPICAMRAQSTASLPLRTPSPLATDPHANLRKCGNIENMCWSLGPRCLRLGHETSHDTGHVKSLARYLFRNATAAMSVAKPPPPYLWSKQKQHELKTLIYRILTLTTFMRPHAQRGMRLRGCPWPHLSKCVYIGITFWGFGPK